MLIAVIGAASAIDSVAPEQVQSSQLVLFYLPDCPHNGPYFSYLEEQASHFALGLAQKRPVKLNCKEHRQFCDSYQLAYYPLLAKTAADGALQIVPLPQPQSHELTRQNAANHFSKGRLFVYLSSVRIPDSEEVLWVNVSTDFGMELQQWLGKGLWLLDYSRNWTRRYYLGKMFEPPADLSNLTEFHTSGRVEGHSLTFNSFEVKVLKSPRPSLVLFHAASCGPSRYSAHVFGQLAAELKEVQVVSYNLSANDPPLQGLARLPSVRLFRNSSWHEYHGRVTRSRVLEWLRQLM